MMVNKHALGLERLDNFAQAVNAVQGVEIKAEDELCFIQHVFCTEFPAW